MLKRWSFCLVDGVKCCSDPLFVVKVDIKYYYCTSKSNYNKTFETMHQPSVSHQSCGGLMESMMFVHDTKQWFFAHGHRNTMQIRQIKQDAIHFNAFSKTTESRICLCEV